MNDDGIPRSTDETTRRIAAALGQMPKRRREIFLLHRLDGLDYAAIAGRFDIGVDDVERQIASALLHIAGEVDRPAPARWRHWLQGFAKFFRAP